MWQLVFPARSKASLTLRQFSSCCGVTGLALDSPSCRL